MTTATKSPASSTGKGYKALAIQRGETFSVAFEPLRPKQGFNERVVFTGIPELAESIRTNGFSKLTPLIVEWNPTDQCFDVIHGERRYRACQYLVDQGIDPGPIWCMSESRNKEPLQQLIDQVLTNTGEQFTPLEKGRLYLRIQRDFPGTTGTEIAKRVGETKQAVSQALRLAKLSCDTIQEAIIRGQISCNTAQQILDSAGEDPAAQVKLLDETLQAATSTGKSHATPKHLPPSSSSNSQPSTLNSQPSTSSDAPADPGAIQRIQAAPSTDRSGNSGPGSGKYEAPDKRLKGLESLLDELDKAGKGDEARITTTEIVLGYLNNERDRKSLKDHLLGK